MKKDWKWLFSIIKHAFGLIFGKSNKAIQPIATEITNKDHIEKLHTEIPETKIAPLQVSAKESEPVFKKFKPQSNKRKHLMDYEESRYLMKNNKLHIEYSGDSLHNGANTYLDKLINKIMKADSMYKGRIESMRCTRLERAQEIVKGIQTYCIRRATFTDSRGQQFQII